MKTFYKILILLLSVLLMSGCVDTNESEWSDPSVISNIKKNDIKREIRKRTGKGYGDILGYPITESYFENGKVVEEKCYDFDMTLQQSYSYEYDSNGNLKKKSDSAGGWTEYNYEDNGNNYSATVYDQFGNYDYATRYKEDVELDALGKIVKSRNCYIHEYAYMDSWSSWFESDYDKAGNVIRRIQYKVNTLPEAGEIYGSEEYEYDRQGNVIKTIYNYPNDSQRASMDTHDYQYDKRGNVVKETLLFYDSNGSIYSKSAYEKEYDTVGNLIKASKFDSDGNCEYWYEYEYEYYD